MVRLPRNVLPESCEVHVYSRTIRRERLFLSERDGFAFLFRTALAVEQNPVECRAYCLMPNHFHLQLFGARDAISRLLQWLLGGYATWFNREHGYRGHLFGDRYGARLVQDDAGRLRVARYIVGNPVVAELCRQPREWRWSSYRAMTGLEPTPAFLTLDWLDRSIGRDAFRLYVDEGLAAAVRLLP